MRLTLKKLAIVAALAALPISVALAQISGNGGSGPAASILGVTYPKPTKAGLGFTTNYGISGGYTQTDTAIGVNFADTTNIGATIEGSLKPYPTPPFTYTAILTIMPSSDLSVCMGPAASATGASEIVVQHSSGTSLAPGTTDVEDWTAPATFSTTVANTQRNFVGGGRIWMRYHDDGTTITYSTSTDGVNWDTTFSIAKASDFLTTNGGFHFFGVIISTFNGAGGTVMVGQTQTAS